MLAGAFYPRADTGFGYGPRDGSLPRRPQTVEPILDAASLLEPLTSFNENLHHQIYASEPSDDGTSKPPPKPEGFSDPYLYPMLTRNERLRLTMLWYYTRDLLGDEDLLKKMQAKVDLLASIIGWDFAICGLIDNDIFERLSTTGLPLARLPRRESTCSHTVLQQPSSSVFFIPDLSDDWRFKESPHVSQGGLRTYAGAQLRCRVDGNDQDLALGSVCVASNTPGLALKPSQLEIIVKFADMLTEDIINGSRRKRAKQQELNDALLQEAFAESFKNPTEAAVLRILGQAFPKAQLSLLPVEGGRVQLQNGPSVEVPDVHVKSTTWEDHDLIEQLLRNHNHERLSATQPVRAIIGTFPSNAVNTALVVSTTDITFIFDDVDVRFVEGCAMILRSVGQERSLQEALKTRERFLRGITHQLRTPIHGILGSVDLLVDELSKSRRNRLASAPTDHRVPENLRMIQSSGRELMSTVNNVIKFNRWTDSVRTSKTATLGALDTLESEILEEISSLLPSDQLDRMSILFCNQLPAEVGAVQIDTIVVKDCLQSLILNAVQNTEQGSVVISTSMASDRSTIIFDVHDTGCGIPVSDQSRIFDAYEKGNAHSTGAGLGLTLAYNIANALNGAVTLVSSVPGVGSHFQAQFREPSFACSMDGARAVVKESVLPSRFAILSSSNPVSTFDEHLAHVLETRGLELTKDIADALVVVPFHNQQYEDLLHQAAQCPVTISLVPAGQDVSKYQKSYPGIMFFSGPFTSKRLEEIIVATRSTCMARRSSSSKVQHTADSEVSIEARPVAQRYDSVAPEHLSRLNAMTLNAATPNCLIVDDNVINLRIMKMYCETRKFPYTTAVDGLQAVYKYKEAVAGIPINLILLDLQMPNCDGIEACEQIRDFEAKEGLSPAAIFIGQYSPAA